MSSSTEDDTDFEYDKVVSELQKQVLSELFHTHILQKLWQINSGSPRS